MKLAFGVFCLLVAGLAAYFGQPLVRGNSDLVQIIITVFSVFAGFLIAIIAIIGDPALIPAGSWRVAELRRDSIQNRLTLHVALFLLYLITIAVLFTGVVVSKMSATDGELWHAARIWIERCYLFLGVFSFLLSFGLPWSLVKIQSARVDAEIERRRKEANICEGRVDSEGA